jgi:CMP-N,N'-diacetyllegionaminic acid synthase
MKAWGFIPARGGSKSIPLKNILTLGGRPMLDYGIKAGLASGRLERLICSSDDERILGPARDLGIDVDVRSHELSGDDVPVAEVVREFLERQSDRPDIIVLIQPTSPFLLPEHVGLLLDAFERDPEVNSAHTATLCTHNAHAWNQRTLEEDGRIGFMFAAERKQAYNKQRKPKLHIFGNVIGTKSDALLRGEGFYAEPVAGVEIPFPYNYDLDGPDDIAVAEALLSNGSVRLPHMEG